MKTDTPLTRLLIITYVALIACNNSSLNDDNNKTLDKKIEQSPLETVNYETDNETFDPIEDEDIETNREILYFDRAEWYVPSENKEVFTGINRCLMSGVIINYIKNNHLDPKKEEKHIGDSIIIDFEQEKFSYYRKTVSNSSKYDAEINRMSQEYRVFQDENVAEEELTRQENLLKQKLAEIDTALKKVKLTDYYVVKGTFKIQKVKNNKITVAFNGSISVFDGLLWLIYGENGPSYGPLFTDTASIDLLVAFNDFGASNKLNKYMLENINNEHLKYLRNQFFARKGYKFKTEAMQEYFGTKEWYTPEYDDVSSLLTKTEKYNAEFIKKAEEELK